MENCEDYEDCRNKDNSLKCDKCERNPFNWEKMKKDGDGEVHEMKNKSFYIFRDNFEEL